MTKFLGIQLARGHLTHPTAFNCNTCGLSQNKIYLKILRDESLSFILVLAMGSHSLCS